MATPVSIESSAARGGRPLFFGEECMKPFEYYEPASLAEAADSAEAAGQDGQHHRRAAPICCRV